MKKILLLLLIIILSIELTLRGIGLAYLFFQTGQTNINKKGKVKILCIGESTTFGWGEKRGIDYPSQLNKLLESKYPGRFIVYNRGVPGTISLKILSYMKRFLQDIRPDFIIILCAVNEYNPRLNIYRLESRYSLMGKFSDILINLRNDMKIYKMFMAMMDFMRYECGFGCAIAPKAVNCSEFDEDTIVLLREKYFDNIEKIVALSREAGAIVMFSTYLWPWVNYQDIKLAAYYNKAVLCDQVEMLKHSGIAVSEVMSKDNFHPNAFGYKLMAESLMRSLEEMPIFLQYANSN